MKMISTLCLIFALSGCGGGNALSQPTAAQQPVTTSPAQEAKAVVSITFDDGWKSALNNGIPVFNNAGFPVTAYVVTKYNGVAGYMTHTDILGLYALGNEIGVHTQTHPCLADIQVLQPNGQWSEAGACLKSGYKQPEQTTDNELAQEQEIAGAIKDLAALGLSPKSIAYPYGNFNDKTKQIAARNGLMAGRTVDSWTTLTNTSTTDKFALHARCVENNGETDEQLAALITADIDNAIKNKSWYILCLHHVDHPDPSSARYNVSSKTLQMVVDHLKSTGVSVKTVEQVISTMR